MKKSRFIEKDGKVQFELSPEEKERVRLRNNIVNLSKVIKKSQLMYTYNLLAYRGVYPDLTLLDKNQGTIAAVRSRSLSVTGTLETVWES